MLSRRRTRPTRAARLASCRIEALESRQLLSVDLLPAPTPMGSAEVTSYAVPGAIGRPVAATGVGVPASGPWSAAPRATGPSTPGPYTPAQIRHAYGFDQLSYDGTGQTIAIVDAYDSPTIAADLAAFDARYNLPAAKLIKATPGGGTPASDSGWALEIALDVEWAHVTAPGATILLVEANSASDTDLLAGVDYAVARGAKQVSMSWGGGEFYGVSSLDSHFNTSGVTFLASSGDSGQAVDFPAVSPYVVGVGGTTISLDSAGNKLSETSWSGSGGGTSGVVARPSFQGGFQPGSTRGVPDVSYDAAPGSGVVVIDGGVTYGVGGTSAGAPQWAGLIALANQGRAATGQSSLGTGQAFGTNSVLYNLAGGSSYTNPNGDFLDITSGSNGTPAGVGYDTVTGLGSPVANRLVPDLVAKPTPPPPPSATPAVADAGFESVALPPWTGYTFDPAGSPWAFSGSAGVTANGSTLTAANPNAPQGNQVAFLQLQGAMSQSVADWAAGSYQVAFAAAQRGSYGGSRQDFRVLVDGQAVSTFTPSSTSYLAYSTASFTVTAGAHTITFQGLDSAGGDNTAFIDNVSITTG